MQNTTVEAIILGRKNWGEADRLLFLYSKELGKIKLVAKGSRKIKSKMASHIEPFTVGVYHYVQGKSMPILVGAEAINHNEELSKNLSTLTAASYLCELLEISTDENIPNSDIYETLTKTLALLCTEQPTKQELLLRYFEFLLLKTSGYGPNYHTCKNCHGKLTEKEYYFGNFEGVNCCECENNGKKIDKNTFKVLRMFDKETLEKILTVRDIESHGEKLKDVITPYLYDIIPKIPKSQKI